MAHVAGELSQENNQEKVNHVKNSDLVTSIYEQGSLTQKTIFMQEFEQEISIEESRKKVHTKIDSLWSK